MKSLLAAVAFAGLLALGCSRDPIHSNQSNQQPTTKPDGGNPNSVPTRGQNAQQGTQTRPNTNRGNQSQ